MVSLHRILASLVSHGFLTENKITMNSLKSKFLITGIGLLFLIFYLVFFHQEALLSVSQKNMCKAKSKALNVGFSGILIRKYEDSSDHLKRKVEIMTNNGIFKSSFLASEVSGFYEEILVGDTLIKEKNSLEIEVIRSNDTLRYFLDYMCSTDRPS